MRVRIRQTREEHSMFQEELSEAMDMSVSMFYRFESGVRVLATDSLFYIADILGMPISELLPPSCRKENQRVKRIYKSSN